MKDFTASRLKSLREHVVKDIWPKEGSWETWATSTLKAEGEPPKIVQGNYESEAANYNWSCMFSAGSIIDKKAETAWSEGVPGDGVGEAVLFPVKYFERGKRINATLRIFNGYGKNRRLWENNNRVKDVILHIATAKNGGIESWSGYSHITHRCRIPLTLQDKFGYQTMKVPLANCTWDVQISAEDLQMGAEIEKALIVALEIVSVYKGKKYQDTLISDADLY